MRDDKLKSLLRDAEAGMERPNFAPADLAGRIRRLDRRRRRRTRMFLAAVPLMALGTIIAGWSLLPNPAPMKIEDRMASVPFDAGEIERLRAEAEYHQRLARQMIALRKRDRTLEQARRVLAQPDPLDQIREQIDIVAYRMIQRADELRTQMEPSAEAIRVYRDVESLFPNTYAAEVARERLGTLGAPKGET